MKAPISTLLALLFLMLPVLQNPAARAEAPVRLKIGVVSGLTGIAAKWNAYQNRGMELAAEEFRREGHDLELVFEDSQTLGIKVIAAFNKLIDYDKVDAVIADDFGFVVAPLIPLADQRKKLLLALSLPQDNYCAQSKGFFFSITSQFVFSEAAFEKFFTLHPEIKKAAAFVFDDPEWGQAYLKIWKKIAARRGVEIVSEFLTSEPVPDFKVALAKALAQNPDLLLLAHEPITFSKAVRVAHYKGPILSANNFLEAIAAREDLGAVINQVFIVDPETDPAFIRKFEERFNEAPILEAYAGYEAVRAVVRAFMADREHPEAAMRRLKYKGLAGEIDFTGRSCAGNQTRWELYKFKDYKPVKLGGATYRAQKP